MQQAAKFFPQKGDTTPPEKPKNDLKAYVTMRVQHICMNINDLWKCFLELFYKKGFRIFITLTIGISLIFIGSGFTFTNRIQEVPDWNKIGPAILIASDKPLCGAEVLVSTEDDGITNIFIREEDADKILAASLTEHGGADGDETQSERDENEKENQGEQIKTSTVPQEEYHLWICLNSLEDVPIDWDIQDQLGDIRNYELLQLTPDNSHEFFARETNKNHGSDYVTAFKITYGGTHFGMVQIRISEDPKHAVFRGNGIYKPRLPFVFAWPGYEHDSDIEELMDDFAERSPYLNDEDLLRLTINKCQMYLPILKIMSSYASLSLAEQHDLEPMWISPEPEDGYPLIRWTQYLQSFPVVQFRDKMWESNAKRNNLLGGIFVGLGINVLLTFSNLNPVKKKR